MENSRNVPNAKPKTSSKDMDSNSNNETIENQRESKRRKSSEISEANPKTTSKDTDPNNNETVENPRESKRSKLNVEKDAPEVPDAENTISQDKESDSNKQIVETSSENGSNANENVTGSLDAAKKSISKDDESDPTNKTSGDSATSKKGSTVDEDVTNLLQAEDTSNTKKIILKDKGECEFQKKSAEDPTQMSNETQTEQNRSKRMRRQTMDEIPRKKNGLRNRGLRKRPSRSSLPLSYAS